MWSRQKSGDWFVIEESNCSDGRADQVWARIEPGWRCDALKLNASMLVNPTISRALSALRQKGSLTEQDLRTIVGVSLALLRKVMRDLVTARLVISVAGNLYRLAKHISFPKIEICSFEMKLDNWKRALYQSTRYRSFSHRVFVVMPDNLAQVIESSRHNFVKTGIGLMTHAADGTSKVIVRPSKKQPSSNYQTLMALGMILSRGTALRLAN